MKNPRFLLLTGMILAAAASRLLPHPPNFTPIGALALFGGAQFADKRLAFLVPLAAMFLSDLVLGLSRMTPIIYGCFALVVCLGFWVRRRQNAWAIGGTSLAGAMAFFLVTNFAVWAGSTMYPHTVNGLVKCYTAAIPFFGNAIAGDLFYAAVLFSALRAMEWRIPRIRESVA